LSEYTLEEVGVYNWPEGEELVYTGQPNQFVLDLPHYSKVPKLAKDQLKWRQDLLDACKGSKANQSRMIGMCHEDVLFWINSWCLTYDPRLKRTTIPFNTWPHQDCVIAAIDHYLGIRDVGVNKSRGEGCSWLVLMIFLHRWLFSREDESGQYGFVSMNEDLVDSSENKDALMWKIDWQLNHLPPWMLPKGFDWRKHRSKGDHTLVNPVNHVTFKGFACTQNVATGGRYTAFMMDELAKWKRPQDSIAMTSTQFVTESRIIVSTPFGNEGAYYDAIHKADTSLLKLTMHWTYNPIRRLGLYRWDTNKDKLVQLDLGFKYPENYPFVRDGKTRSAWYDKECKKANATPRTIAQDLDLNFEQSVELFFEPLAMDLARKTVKGPVHTGRFSCDNYGGEAVFAADPRGNVRLWSKLNNGKLPPSKYVIGVDIAQGTGTDFSSNSVIQVVNMVTGDQVLEWVDNATRPDDCAVIAVSIAKWLQGSGGSQPFLIWECGGPGGEFGRQVDLMGWTNYYNRPDIKKFKRNKLSENRSGFRGSKADALSPLQVAIKLRKVAIYSQELVDELTEYRFIPGGKVEHFKAVVSEDESSKGQNHGDRAMAMAMAIVGMNEFRNPRQPQKPPDSVWRGPNRIELLLKELQSEENGYEACFS
jgi:hypothetical protein